MMHLDHLPNQKTDEKVVLFLRRNWLNPATIIVTLFGFLAVPAAAALFFLDRLTVWFAHPLLGPVLAIVISMYVLAVWLFAFLEFTDYYLDTWIITSERVINIEQQGLFNRVASELHLAAVQDVTSDVKGLIRTFLDFGNVYVQTAAEKERFGLEEIDHPEKVKALILRLVEEDKKRHASSIVAAVAEGNKTMEEAAM